MRIKQILQLADTWCWSATFEYDATLGPYNKILRQQYKVWSFTEPQLKALVKEIEREVLSKYEIIG